MRAVPGPISYAYDWNGKAPTRDWLLPYASAKGATALILVGGSGWGWTTRLCRWNLLPRGNEAEEPSPSERGAF